MPLSRRLPKRGFRNPFREEYRIINLGDLEGFATGSIVDHAVLTAAGIVRSNQQRVKILADGEFSKALTVKAQAFSSKAREKIVALGGAAEVV
jgi:large subunit ribosomal protein L15